MRFSRPKSPGYGISRSYFITALASKAQLPPMLAVINPSGEGGAVQGFGAPLAKDAAQESLASPLRRGAYVLATKDRKTVVRCVVVSKEEAGFNPEAILGSKLEDRLGTEKLSRIRAAWSLVQLAFESYDPSVDVSVKFLMDLAARIADVTDGVVADAIAQKYYLADELLNLAGKMSIDIEFHVAVAQLSESKLQTLGMQKFGLPELEIVGVSSDGIANAERLLIETARTAFEGVTLKPGRRFGTAPVQFELAATSQPTALLSLTSATKDRSITDLLENLGPETL